MTENSIVKKKDELVSHDDVPADSEYRKILEVVPGMEGFDINGMLAKLMQYVNMSDALSHVEKTLEYVVQIPIKHRDAFKAGEVFINQNTKTGVMWPTLYETLENGKRKFVDNLPIKPEEIIHGNPFESIAVSYHNLYMQQQLAELADALQETYRAVKRIEQGQMDDRIGLLLAGRDQIRYSLNAAPEEKIVYKGALEDYPRKDDYNEKKALELAGKNRPDIRIAQKSIEAAEKTALATAGEALPQVDLTSDWMTSSRDYTDRRYTDYDREYWSVGINFTWPFFEGGRTAFGVARDRERVRGLRAAYRDALAAARTDVLTALMDIRAAREVYQTAQEGLKVAEETYAMASERYKSKVGTVTELIDAQTRLTEAETRISKALADFQSARAKLFFHMGLKNTSLR